MAIGCWRPEPYPYQTPTESNDFEIFDSFPFRSQGRELRVGRAPGVRPQPARVACELALALDVQAEVDRDGLTFRDAARRHGCSRMRICRLLALARLAPDIQARVADLTTTTALEALTVANLRWVAEAMDWGEQRDRFRRAATSIAGPPPMLIPSAVVNVPQGG